MELHDWDQIKADQITALYSRKVAVGHNVTVARLEAKAGAATRMHSHLNEEVIVVLKGKWRFFLPSGDVTLQADQMLTIPAGVEHGSEVLEDAVAIDVCAPARLDWINGEDRVLHYDPEQYLWAV
ncbi:MAG: cupin domain-containing protein [Acidobacteriia bacterium]|nr:cupin domain-containing protein [Terriglobia bacterium]